MAEANLLGSPQRLAQYDEGFFREIIGGHDIIGPLIIEDVNLVSVDKLRKFQRLLAFQLHRLNLFWLQQDIIALADLVAFDDVLRLDGTDARDRLLVTDTLAAGLVDLVKGNLGARLGRGVNFDRYRNQREPDLPLPICARRHCPIPPYRRNAQALARVPGSAEDAVPMSRARQIG